MAGESARWHRALRVLIGTAITAAVLGVIAYFAQQPFMFPSVGPTIFILFFATMSAQAAPRNVIFGQGIGIVCGYLSLILLGLTDVAPDVVNPSSRSMISALLALALTSFLMVGLGAVHSPAAATTLIIGLGFIRLPIHLVVLMSAIVTVIVIAYLVNRAYGLRPPLWRPVTPAA